MASDEMPLKEEELSFVLRNMEDAVFVTGQQGVIRYMNPAAGTLLGTDPAAAAGKRIWEVIPFVEGNDGLIQMFIDMVSSGAPSQKKLVDYEKADGSLCRLHVSMSFEKAQGNSFLIVIHNLTELTRVHAAFRRYTSSEIAEYVLSAPDGEKQGGAARDVTILMSDIRGFTALSRDLEPEALVVLLNHYFEEMVRVTEAHGGTVIEFLGDGIFLVFGAPKDDPEHAAHAVTCAVEMQNAMEGVNVWNKAHGFPELEMGIGINSGTAVVGNIGSAQKMKYGCMGETVNLAGRVESKTVGGQIYITEETRNRIREPLTLSGTHSILPKGNGRRLRIFSVEGVGESRVRSRRNREDAWIRVTGDGTVRCHLLKGKEVEEAPFPGRVVSLSGDGRSALMHTDRTLEELQDLLIEIAAPAGNAGSPEAAGEANQEEEADARTGRGGGDLYGKVTKRAEDGGYVVCFTARPAAFSAWRRAMTGA